MGSRAPSLFCSLLSLVLTACGVSPARTPNAGEPTITAPPSLDVAVLRSLVDVDGGALDVTEHLRRGKSIALVFWQPWCPACRREAPGLVDAQKQFGEQMQVVGVVSGPDSSVDDDEVRRTAKELGMAFPQVRDRDLRLAKLLQVTQTPTIVLFDGELRVHYRSHYLPANWSTVLEAH